MSDLGFGAEIVAKGYRRRGPLDRGPHQDHQRRGLEAPADLTSGLATSLL